MSAGESGATGGVPTTDALLAPAGEPVSWIGFPPPLLGDAPCRLPVRLHAAGLLALERPPGVAPTYHDWSPAAPDLAAALQTQAREGKPELTRLGVSEVHPLVALEAECSGLALYLTDRETAARWRNALGSGQLTFAFLLLTYAPLEGPRSCDLPVARHFEQPRLVVSHQTGKRTATAFTPVARWGPLQLVLAMTTYVRPHAIRLHAAESGVPVIGDTLYGEAAPLLLSRWKRRYKKREAERPLHEGPLVHLWRLTAALPAEPTRTLEAPLPRAWRTIARQAAQAGR